MTFANGNRAIALCDRCGQQYKYLQLRQEWNGLFTCPDCFEPKHPQLDPGHHPADAIALRDPRPARQEPVIVFVGAPGDSAFESDGMHTFYTKQRVAYWIKCWYSSVVIS